VAALRVFEISDCLLVALQGGLQLVDLFVLLFDCVVSLLHFCFQMVYFAVQVQLVVLEANLVPMHKLLHFDLAFSDLLLDLVVLFKEDQVK